MWVLFIIVAAAALLIFALSRVRVVLFVEYCGGKLVLKLSLGLAFGLLPVSARAEYAKGRIRYSLPWAEVDESIESFVKNIAGIKKEKEKRWITIPVRRILSSFRIAKFRLKSTIGVQDAAKCALLCGLVQGALYALLAPLDWKAGAYPVIEVIPAFNRRVFSLKLEGIAWFLPAQIIFEGNQKASFKASAGG